MDIAVIKERGGEATLETYSLSNNCAIELKEKREGMNSNWWGHATINYVENKEVE